MEEARAARLAEEVCLTQNILLCTALLHGTHRLSRALSGVPSDEAEITFQAEHFAQFILDGLAAGARRIAKAQR